MAAQSINNMASWEIEVSRQLYQDLLKVISVPFWIAVLSLLALPGVLFYLFLHFGWPPLLAVQWTWWSHFTWSFPACFCDWNGLEMDSELLPEWEGGGLCQQPGSLSSSVDQRPTFSFWDSAHRTRPPQFCSHSSHAPSVILGRPWDCPKLSKQVFARLTFLFF